MQLALYCVNPDSSRGARSTSRKINMAHGNRTRAASNCTRGPCKGSSTLTLRALRLCFQRTATEKLAACRDAELLCLLLLPWKPFWNSWCVILQGNGINLKLLFQSRSWGFFIDVSPKKKINPHDFLLWRWKGKGFKLLLKMNSESYWNISLALASQNCMCFPLTAEYKSRQKRFRIENGFWAEIQKLL